MQGRDRIASNGLCHRRPGFTLVARPPGACEITVLGRHHFLDVHLGKSEASYEVEGLENLGSAAPPSTFVFLPANGERKIRAIRSGWSVQIAFDATMLGVYFGRQDPDANGHDEALGLRAICHAEDEPMVNIAQHLGGVWAGELPWPTHEQLDAVATLLIMRVFHYVLHRDPRPPKTPAVSRKVQRVLRHIEDNLSETHSLDSLAVVAGVSAYHFARKFRQATGRSLHQYVVERRLAHAKRRLRSSDDPIVEIAHDCGFGSQSHMTDVFSKVLGTTPGEVRRQAL